MCNFSCIIVKCTYTVIVVVQPQNKLITLSTNILTVFNIDDSEKNLRFYFFFFYFCIIYALLVSISESLFSNAPVYFSIILIKCKKT